MQLTFPQISARARRALAAALCMGAGFALGFGLGRQSIAACRTSDLTTTPDTSFLEAAPNSPALPEQPPAADTAPAESAPAPLAAPAKRVCLTFDDGPSKTTPAVLEALSAEGVPATFFVVATGHNDKYLPLVRQAQLAGHQIALHSASHEYGDIYRSTRAFWDDIALLKERLAPYIDAEAIDCLRFPGGSTNTVSRKYGGSGLMQTLKSQAEERGYRWVDWNVCAEDAAGQRLSAEQIYRNIVRETGEQTSCIVLMHDSASTGTTAEALPDIIRWYKENGYTFCTLSELYADS